MKSELCIGKLKNLKKIKIRTISMMKKRNN